MRKLIIIIILFAIVNNVQAQRKKASETVFEEKEPQLKLLTNADTVKINTEVKFTLRLEGVKLSGLEDAVYINHYHDHSFYNKSFYLIMKERGTHSFGPYTLEIGKKKYKSNTVAIVVSEYEPDNIISFTGPDSIKIGDMVDISIVSRKKTIEGLKNKGNSGFDIISGTASSKITLEGGKMKKIFTHKYRIQFNQTGKYVFDGNSLSSTPKWAIIKPKTIVVQ